MEHLSERIDQLVSQWESIRTKDIDPKRKTEHLIKLENWIERVRDQLSEEFFKQVG